MENEQTKIPNIQFLWFALVIIGGVGYILSFKFSAPSWVELVCFAVVVFALFKATRIWVKYNPRNTDDPNDVMM